jgi:hypothetical protein
MGNYVEEIQRKLRGIGRHFKSSQGTWLIDMKFMKEGQNEEAPDNV